jgi:uncharacterized protein HemX
MSDDQIEKQNREKKESKRTKSSKSNVAWVPLAIIIGLIGSGLGGYSLYLNYESSSNRLIKTKFATLDAKVAQANDSLMHLKVSEISLTQKVSELRDRDQQIKSAVNQMLGSYEGQLAVLQQAITQVKSTYLLPQSELRQQVELVNINAARIYLNMADQYIAITGDKKSGISLAEKSEQVLMILGEPANESISKIRIAITALKASENDGLKDEVAKLGQLETLSVGLGLKLPSDLHNKKVKSAATWQEGLGQSWDKMKSLITVSELDGTDSALLNSRVRSQIIMTLQFDVEQAKISILRGDQKMYQNSMDSANNLVIKYFQQNAQYNQWIKLASTINFPDTTKHVISLNAAIEAVDKLNKAYFNNQKDTVQIESKTAENKGNK